MPKLPSAPPDLSVAHGRLRWARENYVTPDSGRLTSPRRAAAFFGWKVDTYKSHENGIRSKRGFTEEDARKYARAYGVTVTWLMSGTGRVLRNKGDDFDELDPEEKAKAMRLLRASK